jgi:hypothetical protein
MPAQIQARSENPSRPWRRRIPEKFCANKNVHPLRANSHASREGPSKLPHSDLVTDRDVPSAPKRSRAKPRKAKLKTEPKTKAAKPKTKAAKPKFRAKTATKHRGRKIQVSDPPLLRKK